MTTATKFVRATRPEYFLLVSVTHNAINVKLAAVCDTSIYSLYLRYICVADVSLILGAFQSFLLLVLNEFELARV